MAKPNSPTLQVSARPSGPLELFFHQERLLPAVKDEIAAYCHRFLDPTQRAEFDAQLKDVSYNTPFSRFVPAFDAHKRAELDQYLAARFIVKASQLRHGSTETYTISQAADNILRAAGLEE